MDRGTVFGLVIALLLFGYLVWVARWRPSKVVSEGAGFLLGITIFAVMCLIFLFNAGY
jgi:hypothetical protein